jgi:hypothetical protein
MPQLRQQPGTSTPRQRSKLVVAAKRRGISLDELRAAVGGSVRALSSQQASDLIKQYTGRDLPNPPGQKPRPCDRKRRTTGTTRMIDNDQVDQIERLLGEYFPDLDAGLLWLSGNFKTPRIAAVDRDDVQYAIRRLATAKRAGEVIRALKLMLERRVGCAHQNRAQGNKGSRDQEKEHAS